MQTVPGAEAAIRAQIAAERARRAELVRALAESEALLQRKKEASRQRTDPSRGRLTWRIEEIIACVPGVVWEARRIPGTKKVEMTFVSHYMTTLTGYLPGECVGNPDFLAKLIHPEDLAHAIRDALALRETGSAPLHNRWITRDARILWIENHIRVLRDAAGSPIGACGVAMDITDLKVAEEEQTRLEEQLVRMQAEALLELSAPLIPISAEVLVMPLVGSVNLARAGRVIEVLLEGITRTRARFAILDLTGVPSVDVETADALARTARAVALLGATVVLTGIRPEVAQALVRLGTSLDNIATCRTLGSGIKYTTRRR
jgi:rsbT co-antagonist protein RsbR